MADQRYSRQTVEWILSNLLELRQGRWPDPESPELAPVSKRIISSHAPFETPAGMAAIIEANLSKCGFDGLMVKVYFVLGEANCELAHIARCSERAVARRIKKVLQYISGKPKGVDYLDFRDQKKRQFHRKSVPT